MKLKVFTFNLRVNVESDGINAFPNRKERILNTVHEYQPDLIGFQEADDEMREWLHTALTDYTVVGCGRNADWRGESPVLAYRHDSFEALWTDQFWLSPTPRVPGSRYNGIGQSLCPRTVVAVCLKHKNAQSPFLFCNTHFDHMESTPRLLSAVQTIQYVSEKGLPFILTGDLNARPNTPEIAFLTNVRSFPVTDITQNIKHTFHNFGKISEKKIDYIFTNLPADPEESFTVPDEGIDGVYISDHYPVCGFVEIE